MSKFLEYRTKEFPEWLEGHVMEDFECAQCDAMICEEDAVVCENCGDICCPDCMSNEAAEAGRDLCESCCNHLDIYNTQ